MQSHYARIAKSSAASSFEVEYANKALLLDEIDALIIEEPNDAFVYPNSALSDFATLLAKDLLMHNSVREGNTVR